MGTPADAGDAPAAQGNTPSLPEPTGPCPVGTTSLWLKDTSRPDPWAAGVNMRELMVSLWYPAVASDGRRARYMTPAEAELQLTSRGITGFRPDVLSMTRTNAVSGATPAGDQRSLPLVVLSPGFTNRSWALSNSEHCPVGGPERSWVTWSGGVAREAVTVFRHGRGCRWAWRDPPSLSRIRHEGAPGVALTARSWSRACHTCASSRPRTFCVLLQDSTRERYRVREITICQTVPHPRSTLTALAEDLASHGYVAAGIDHTYESCATAFPDGRVTTGLARQGPRRARWENVVASRTADIAFVLGELTGAHPAWPGAALIDPSRMAMAGHSMGGAAAIAAMLADSRIRAGIDMDGATVAEIPDEGLSRPFLFLGKESSYTPGRHSPDMPGKPGPAITWERDWRLLAGWKRWLLVAGAVHASFTDLGLLADQIGLDIGAGIPGARALDITRAYVRAFFDQHLRGKPQSLLDQPSPRYPEVTFCSPETEPR